MIIGFEVSANLKLIGSVRVYECTKKQNFSIKNAISTVSDQNYPWYSSIEAAISLSNTNSPRRPKSIIFGKSVAESEQSSGTIQATGTMREAFPASLPTTDHGSPGLEKTQRKLTGQQSLQQLDAPKTNTSASGSSPKKDSTDSINSSGQFQKSKKTTTKLGHSPHHHRNSSPNTKYGSYCTGSPTLKSDLKTHPERGTYIHNPSNFFLFFAIYCEVGSEKFSNFIPIGKTAFARIEFKF